MTQDGFVVYNNAEEESFHLMYTVSGGCGKGCVSCSATTKGCNVKSYGPFTYNKNDFDIKNGRFVEVEIYPKIHLIPALILLILPIAEFFLGYIIYSYFSVFFFIISTILMVFFYGFMLIKFNKSWKKITKGEIIKIKR